MWVVPVVSCTGAAVGTGDLGKVLFCKTYIAALSYLLYCEADTPAQSYHLYIYIHIVPNTTAYCR